MAVTRTQIAKQIEEGLNAVFGDTYRNHMDEWPLVFNRENSNKAFEEDVNMSGFGAAVVKSEGASVTYDTAQETYTARYTHDTIALAVSITEEAIDDNLYDRLVPRFGRGLARSMKHTCELRGANVLNRATTSGYTGGDGVVLLSASHPTLAGNQSNVLATPADFSEASLEDVLIKIRTAKDERGLPLAAKPIRIISSPYQEYNIERVLKSTDRSGTADNDVNAIRNMSVFGQAPAIITRLTDTDAWFVSTDVPDGMKCFVRKNTQQKMEPEFNTGNLRYKVTRRDSFGWSDWRGIYGSMGA